MIGMNNKTRIVAANAIFITTIVGVIFNSEVTQAMTSAGSTFSQVIRELDCSHTTYSKTVGQVNDAECDVFAPKYDHSAIKDKRKRGNNHKIKIRNYLVGSEK